jgi:ubiquinone/menaquinone biosynthesis C-methylase UbiE
MIGLAASHDHPVLAVVGDAAALPFRDESFDLDVAYMCLHDLDEMPRSVAEVARVLAPGGRLGAYFAALEAAGLLTEIVREVASPEEGARLDLPVPPASRGCFSR